MISQFASFVAFSVVSIQKTNRRFYAIIILFWNPKHSNYKWNASTFTTTYTLYKKYTDLLFNNGHGILDIDQFLVHQVFFFDHFQDFFSLSQQTSSLPFLSLGRQLAFFPLALLVQQLLNVYVPLMYRIFSSSVYSDSFKSLFPFRLLPFLCRSELCNNMEG